MILETKNEIELVAYIAMIYDEEEEIIVLAENIAQAFDKLEKAGCIDSRLVKHKSYRVLF